MSSKNASWNLLVSSRSNKTRLKFARRSFDLWWEWAEKPLDSPLTIDAEIHDAVMALQPDERRDRAKVNEAVRDGLKLVRCARPAARINTACRRRRSNIPQRAK
jgi:hypothetical protein